MDTESMKSELSKVGRAFEREGKPLTFAGIVPAYPGLHDTSYIYQVSGSFLEKNPKAIRAVTEKIFQELSPEVRRYIHAVRIYDPTNPQSAPLLYPSEEYILTNKLNFKPDPVLYYHSIESDD